jgi:hypothetical protein
MGYPVTTTEGFSQFGGGVVALDRAAGLAQLCDLGLQFGLLAGQGIPDGSWMVGQGPTGMFGEEAFLDEAPENSVGMAAGLAQEACHAGACE